jgi:hypothetical protein
MLIQVLGHVEVRSASGREIHLRPREKAVLGILLLCSDLACPGAKAVWGLPGLRGLAAFPRPACGARQ